MARKKDPLLPKVAERLREARIALKISQGGAAARLGVSRPTYRAYEAGRNSMPYEVQYRLPDAFGRPIGWFLGRNDAGGDLAPEEMQLLAAFRLIRCPGLRRSLVELTLAQQQAEDETLRQLVESAQCCGRQVQLMGDPPGA